MSGFKANITIDYCYKQQGFMMFMHPDNSMPGYENVWRIDVTKAIYSGADDVAYAEDAARAYQLLAAGKTPREIRGIFARAHAWHNAV